MSSIRFDYGHALSFMEEKELSQLAAEAELAERKLQGEIKEAAGADFLGWVKWPETYDKEEYSRLKEAAKRIRENSDVLLVIGIGGSYLGARAGIEMLHHRFYNQLSKDVRKGPEVYFLGHHLSSDYVQDLYSLLDGKDVSINVISKSGTTTEPAVAFRILREYMEKRYGKEEASKRIYATTDRARGALKTLANDEGYETFTIDDDIGGRYSVLTPVGLLPLAVSGLDTDAMLAGAAQAMNEYATADWSKNSCYQYAIARQVLYRKGYTTELFVTYQPALAYFAEWWKQLFGESEGKNQKGVFPASVQFTTDLHSMGQYIQQGLRNLYETVLFVDKSEHQITIPRDDQDLDGLNYLAGKPMDFVNEKAFEGTLLAHTEGGVPNLVVRVPELSSYIFGQLVYFFEKACGISSYLQGVNPFDQPGVEAYKQHMFALLGKPKK
ncbi:glucose-6-phosphate isomerase [Shimazuella sp. AN120528]|uniref:glucose-6-phosphate isomerase n=1 Tax=Shimazuella soli TaxID=1892854 RepID=UPI001F0CEAD3|nr:glucose-6-phosphate isomerase [Shimazuella soli]MCH5584163.1 glucose-6-phosphate isomerase [Shimazuella soli]